MALDNRYLYPTIVTISSITENTNPRNKYWFYIMYSDDLKDKKKLENLGKKYKRCTIELIHMKVKYKDSHI